MSTDAVVLGLVFVSVLLLADGALSMLGARRGADGNRLRPKGGGESQAVALRKGGRPEPLLAWLDARLSQAGMRLPAERAAVAMASATVAAGMGLAGVVPLPLPLVAAPVFGIGVPLLVLAARRRRRLARFTRQLPAALDTVVLSLRAGHPVNAAIAMVARKMPDPIGTEFAVVCDEMTYGLDLREALVNLGRRVPVEDLHFLVVAIRIQMGTGGNLAGLLAALARMMRERDKLHGKIKALSAEGRLSAVILAAMPFLVIAAVTAFNPSYYGSLAGDTTTRALVIGGFCGLFLGVFLIARMVRFKV